MNFILHRPTKPLAIPMDEQSNFLYSPEHIERYQAVLFHEALRCHPALADALKNDPQVKLPLSMAGGLPRKSALLNRIASGLWPFVVPPPVAMSYPWYEVVESDEPIELWLGGENAAALIALASRCAPALPGLRPEPAGQRALIEQSFWDVLEVIDETAMDVTQAGWKALGFAWRLSIDKVPASQTAQFMASWHDPSIGRITTLDQLVKEKAWHVNRRLQDMRAALDPVLAENALAQARQKDGATSRFHQLSLQQRLHAQRDVMHARELAGKPALPDAQEIEQMVASDVDKVFSRRDGSGWYSAGPEGELFVHTWRIRRTLPVVLSESVYLNLNALESAPAGFQA